MARLAALGRRSLESVAATLVLLALLPVSACARSAGGAPIESRPRVASLGQAGFEEVARSDGATVYCHAEAQALHFLAETRFDAPPSQVQHALLDYEGQLGHIGRLSESRILRRRPGELVVYQRLNLPVIDDRDYTLEVRWGTLDWGRWVTFRALPWGPAAPPGVVRVTTHSGSWQLRPLDDGQATLARYETWMDLGGWVPMWMARDSAGREVIQVLVEFNRWMAARPRPERPPSAGTPDGAAPGPP